MANEKITILIDFDGTCTTHDFPRIGKDIGAVPVLKALADAGHKLILFTMRSDNHKKTKPATNEYLAEAVKWFKDNDIPLYGIQTNPTQRYWTSSPKAYGHLMIDDAALGCPLKLDNTLSDKPFVDWNAVERMLFEIGLLEFKPKVSPQDIDMSKVIVTYFKPEDNV